MSAGAAESAVPVKCPPSERVLWWLLVGMGVALLALFARWPGLLKLAGISHYPWFVDFAALTASSDAVALGIDPYINNPLDVFHRPHGYSHWWLVGLRNLGLTSADNVWLGLAVGGAFFVAAVGSLRPRRVGELIGALAVIFSPPILLALDRANNDLVMFVLLTPVVPCLLSSRPVSQVLAAALLVAAAVLKAYPIVALPILLAGATPRDTRRLLLVAALLLLAVAPDTIRDFGRYAALVPERDGLLTMGSRHIFMGLGFSAAMARKLGPLCGLLVIALFWFRRPLGAWAPQPSERGPWLSFILGSLLLVGCFFAGSNFGYRWVFAVWLLPWLWLLRRDDSIPATVRKWGRVTGILLLLSLWLDGFASSLLGSGLFPPGTDLNKIANRFFYLEQPLTWAFYVCLIAFVTHFARDGLYALFGRAPAPASSAAS